MNQQTLRKWTAYFKTSTPNTPQHTQTHRYYNGVFFCFCFVVTLLMLSRGGRIASPTRQGAEANKGWTCKHTQPKPSKEIKMSEDLKQVADLVTANTIFCTKEVLTSEEAARYMGLSMSYLYKLTMQHRIPHYKPMGKLCYFNRLELESWLQSNRIATEDEISQQAQAYCMKKGGKR